MQKNFDIGSAEGVQIIWAWKMHIDQKTAEGLGVL